EIRTGAPVARVLTRNGRVRGVALENGTEIEATRVVSNLDANVTFLRLLDSAELPGDFVEAVRRIDYSSASLKINVALSELPDFIAYPTPAGGEPGPQHHGTIHIAPGMDYIERAYAHAKYGLP